MLTINRARLLANLQELGEIGQTKARGVSRMALSEADLAGRSWFRNKAEAAGFVWQQDGAGNLSAILPADNPEAPTILFGSHLDTVPNGGRFDGALGVVAALEVLQTIHQADVQRPYHLEAISFSDEEGSHVGFLGSRAFAGELTPEDLAHGRQGAAALTNGLERLQISRDSILAARRDPKTLAAFVELHIEQGVRLEQNELDIGVVTAAVGIRPLWLHFQGKAAHSGTTPLTDRADALWGAADFIQRARILVQDKFAPGVMNVGQIEVTPGAFNIIPATARLALEIRHGSERKLDEMAEELFKTAQMAARNLGLKVSLESTSDIRAAPMDPAVIQVIERAAADLGLRSGRLMSFASHDTQVISRIAPAAMFFVPSAAGISHHPEEFTSEVDVVNGANTLLHTVLALMKHPTFRPP